MQYVYTFWLWFKNVFITFFRGLASILYYLSFAFMIAKALLFGFYCVFPIIRPFVRNNTAFNFVMGKKLIDDMDEHDISIKTAFRYFVLPYAFYMMIVVIFRRLISMLLGSG